MGFAGGGKVPGRAPADLRLDNVLGLVDGEPIAVQSEEWIINGRSSKKYDRELAAINAGTFPKLPGYVNGGRDGREYAAWEVACPAGAAGAAPVVAGDTYVQNPFTGEYLLAQVDHRAPLLSPKWISSHSTCAEAAKTQETPTSRNGLAGVSLLF